MRIHHKIPKPREWHLLRGALLTAALLGACSSPTGDQETFAELSQALNVCNETVPANRFVDGLPAYAQCDGTTGAIWSNNGIDTSDASQGPGWVRTQYGGGYQCTEWAWRYMYFKWGVDYRSGDAGDWCDGNLPSSLTKATAPVHGDLIVFAPGSCGADSTTGHVAVIDVVDSDAGTVTLVEQNQAGRRNSKISCGLCFLHAVANDGSASGGSGGAAGTGGAASAGGSGGVGGTFGNGGSPATAGNGGGDSGGSASTGGSSSLPGGGSAGSTGPSSAGAPTGGGGSTAAGAPSVDPGDAAGASGSSNASAGTSASDPGEGEGASCSVRRGAAHRASRGPLIPYLLFLGGLAARRSMLRRKAEQRDE